MPIEKLKPINSPMPQGDGPAVFFGAHGVNSDLTFEKPLYASEDVYAACGAVSRRPHDKSDLAKIGYCCEKGKDRVACLTYQMMVSRFCSYIPQRVSLEHSCLRTGHVILWVRRTL
jgi:hypothetical protein